MKHKIEVLVDGLLCPEGPRWHDGALWYDLADAERRCVKVTPKGWQLVENAGQKTRRDFRDTVFARRVIVALPAGRGLHQTEMNVHTISHGVRVDDGREAGAMSKSLRRGAGGFAQDNRLIGDADPMGRLHGHFILARAVFRHEGIGRQPGPLERGHEQAPKDALSAKGI